MPDTLRSKIEALRDELGRAINSQPRSAKASDLAMVGLMLDVLGKLTVALVCPDAEIVLNAEECDFLAERGRGSPRAAALKAHAARLREVPVADLCRWVYVEDYDEYETDCGRSFVLMAEDLPDDRCPVCGKPVDVLRG